MTKPIDERAESLIIAGKILDTYSYDPDSDESILARQLIRAAEAITDLQAQLSDLQGIDKVADHANEVIGLMQKDIDSLTAELSASREMGPCGKHTKMFSKRVMRLPKNASYPNFVETHYEDDWCIKSRCEPVYVCGCSGIHREDQPAHSNQLMVTCTLCVEIQAERAAVLRLANDAVWEDWGGPIGDLSSVYVTAEISDRIIRLISTSDLLALDRIIAEKVREGRLAEAEQWRKRGAYIGSWEWAENRLTELRAVPAAPPKENSDARQ